MFGIFYFERLELFSKTCDLCREKFRILEWNIQEKMRGRPKTPDRLFFRVVQKVRIRRNIYEHI